MKKITAAAKKSAPKFVGENRVQVTREFAKNAMIFGTPEYKLWRAIKQDCPEAEMALKSIKKNPDKRNSTKNLTYERMAIFIRQQDDAEALMIEFKKQVALSKVQTNPYRCVLAWFKQTFSDYDGYKKFFEEEAKKKAQEEDIFSLRKFSSSVEEDGEDEDFDMAANLSANRQKGDYDYGYH